jgi:hypothetical protein
VDVYAEFDRAKQIADSRERARALAALLRQVTDLNRAVMAERDKAARAMKADGYTGRDIMEALGITKGRVSQVVGSEAVRGSRTATSRRA